MMALNACLNLLYMTMETLIVYSYIHVQSHGNFFKHPGTWWILKNNNTIKRTVVNEVHQFNLENYETRLDKKISKNTSLNFADN